MCFAAGAPISATFLHMIPKASSMTHPQVPAWLLRGFLGLHMFNRFLTAFACEKHPGCKDCAIGLLPMVGIGFHCFIDGFFYSIAFTGSLPPREMVLNDFPEGIVTNLLLVRAGFGDRRAAQLARGQRRHRHKPEHDEPCAGSRLDLKGAIARQYMHLVEERGMA